MEGMNKEIMEAARSAVKECIEKLIKTDRDIFLKEHGGLRIG
jgi:hypothetical protein